MNCNFAQNLLTGWHWLQFSSCVTSNKFFCCKSEIKENWKVIWQKPRESRSLGSLGVLGVSGVSESQTVNCTIAGWLPLCWWYGNDDYCVGGGWWLKAFKWYDERCRPDWQPFPPKVIAHCQRRCEKDHPPSSPSMRIFKKNWLLPPPCSPPVAQMCIPFWNKEQHCFGR